MRRKLVYLPYRVKFKKLVTQMEQSLSTWLSDIDGLLCKIVHVRGKKLHLTVWLLGAKRQLAKLELEKIKNSICSFGLAIEKFVAQDYGVYCCAKVKPLNFA